MLVGCCQRQYGFHLVPPKVYPHDLVVQRKTIRFIGKGREPPGCGPIYAMCLAAYPRV